jgi:hypothetical protein
VDQREALLVHSGTPLMRSAFVGQENLNQNVRW